jgi:uncharacterized protein (DUF433 family)
LHPYEVEETHGGAARRPNWGSGWVYTLVTMVTRLTRITIDPEVCTGKPCIRGLRFPVSRLLGLLAAGQSREQILAAYPYLEAQDIDEALTYAASLAEDESVELAHG